jgi:hypothetical protein
MAPELSSPRHRRTGVYHGSYDVKVLAGTAIHTTKKYEVPIPMDVRRDVRKKYSARKNAEARSKALQTANLNNEVMEPEQEHDSDATVECDFEAMGISEGVSHRHPVSACFCSHNS